jgi:hypothetical protein
MRAYLAHPERERDFFPHAPVFAGVCKRNEVAALVTPDPLWMRKVEVVKRQQLAHRAAVVRQEQALDWLQIFVVYSFNGALLFCLLTQDLVRRSASNQLVDDEYF